MNIFLKITLSVLLLSTVYGLNEVLLAAGNHSKDKPPTLVFINYFDTLPMSHFPVKRSGPRKETPPHSQFILPSYLLYMINTVYVTLSLFLLFHFLRRRPIDDPRTSSTVFIDLNEDDEELLTQMQSSRKSERSRLFFYKRWTNHVATSQKLKASFGRDFDSETRAESVEEYYKKNEVKFEKLQLKKAVGEDDEEL